jgi:hypothetical protein
MQIVTVGVAMTASGLIAVLAGVLSLGEEKNWGTHEWHMTVPVSTSLQWAVKLLVAVVTSVVGAAGVPLAAMILSGWLHGSPFMHVARELLIIAPVEAAVLTLAAFWCACLVKGTMRATMWLFPLFFVLGLAAQFGNWIFTLASSQAVAVLQNVIWKFDPVAISSVTSQLSEQRTVVALAMLVLAPGVVVATVQSHRFFRAQAEDSNLRLLKSAIPLVVTATICGFVVTTAAMFVSEAWEQQGMLIRDTHRVIESLQPGISSPSRPLQLSAEDLAKAAPISDRTRQWLAGSSIVVAPTFPELNVPSPAPPSSRFSRSFSVYAPAAPNKEDVPYAAVIHRASGTTCYITFSTSRHARFGYALGRCE